MMFVIILWNSGGFEYNKKYTVMHTHYHLVSKITGKHRCYYIRTYVRTQRIKGVEREKRQPLRRS